MRKTFIGITCVSLITIGCAGLANAESPEFQEIESAEPAEQVANTESVDKSGLMFIAEFAQVMCGEYASGGSTSSTKLSGETEAELNGILEKIANAGFKGAVEFSAESYVGGLQSRFDDQLDNVRACRLKIFDDLKARFLPTYVKPQESGSSIFTEPWFVTGAVVFAAALINNMQSDPPDRNDEQSRLRLVVPLP